MALVNTPADGVPSAGVVIEQLVVIQTEPEPEIAYSPRTPELLNSTRVFVPPEIAEVPTVSDAPGRLVRREPSA